MPDCCRPTTRFALPSVSGYSGGGRAMIEAYEQGSAPPFELYALGLKHKHIPEIMQYTGLTRRPLFVPSVGQFHSGHAGATATASWTHYPAKPSAQDLTQRIGASHYAGSRMGERWNPLPPDLKLDAVALADTNKLELRVFGNDAAGGWLLRTLCTGCPLGQPGQRRQRRCGPEPAVDAGPVSLTVFALRHLRRRLPGG